MRKFLNGIRDLKRRNSLPRPSDNYDQLNYIVNIVVLSSFTWGYCCGVFNVCLVYDKKGSVFNEISLSTEEQGLINALILLGAWFSSAFINTISEKYGRKAILLFSNVFYVLGSVVTGLAMNSSTLFFGRLVLGFAGGLIGTVIPVYLTEVTSGKYQGQLAIRHTLYVAVGILFSQIVGYFFVTLLPSGWRYINLSIALPALIQCLFHKGIPESPTWLALHGHISMAEEVAEYLNPHLDPEEIVENVAAIASYHSDSKKSQEESSPIMLYKGALFVSVAVRFFQTMTGINSVIFYSSNIFASAGMEQPIVGTITIGIINVVITIISAQLVDRYGRRVLLLGGTAVMFLALVFLSIVLLLMPTTRLQGILAVITTLFYVGGFACGLGPVGWIVMAEVLPAAIRLKAFAIIIGIGYFANILIATSTLSVIQLLGSGSNPGKNGTAKLYIVFAVISFVGVLFMYYCLPETRGNAKMEETKSFLMEHAKEEEQRDPSLYTQSIQENTSCCKLVMDDDNDSELEITIKSREL